MHILSTALGYSILFILLLLELLLDLGYANDLSYGQVLIRDGLKSYSEIELPESVFGPEGVAFDCNGKGPYVGVSDGRILKWHEEDRVWAEFAVTSPTRDKKVCDGLSDTNMEAMCGRPLGLKFNKATCDLYIADAYFGLVVVGPSGGVAQQLATSSADGVSFKFTNALDIDTQTGHVYFTDSSLIFQRRSYLPIILTRERTGRLLKYDPITKSVQVIAKGLAFPNGVALSNDNSFLLLAESTTFKILKVQLNNNNNNDNYDVQFLAQLPRSPDNIKRNSKGHFWVGLNSGRGRIQGFDNNINTNNYNNNEIGSNKVQQFTSDPVGIKLDGEGNVIEVIDGDYGKELDSVSEVEEFDGILWFGSSVQPYVGVIKS